MMKKKYDLNFQVDKISYHDWNLVDGGGYSLEVSTQDYKGIYVGGHRGSEYVENFLEIVVKSAFKEKYPSVEDLVKNDSFAYQFNSYIPEKIKKDLNNISNDQNRWPINLEEYRTYPEKYLTWNGIILGHCDLGNNVAKISCYDFVYQTLQSKINITNVSVKDITMHIFPLQSVDQNKFESIGTREEIRTIKQENETINIPHRYSIYDYIREMYSINVKSSKVYKITDIISSPLDIEKYLIN
ncbi:hypothetical protein [Paenibacillus roseipurpureus]|uniref:Uncharacterized protein n=1 Tax=Paenibacillus roseopurpureus TaxID=2918901 RepID=A0AA96LYN6_9BACL|nr:hypothetical protein [Paenibacillus sp. MBLB1832]WNR46945.1 hypothetical protein MJB10_12950 [Paenibacillus sp. MBLB1832]